jgi:hypothetical protein
VSWTASLPAGVTPLMPWCVLSRTAEAEKRAYAVDQRTIAVYWFHCVSREFLPCTCVTAAELARMPSLLETASPEWRTSVLPNVEATDEDVKRWWGLHLGPFGGRT